MFASYNNNKYPHIDLLRSEEKERSRLVQENVMLLRNAVRLLSRQHFKLSWRMRLTKLSRIRNTERAVCNWLFYTRRFIWNTCLQIVMFFFWKTIINSNDTMIVNLLAFCCLQEWFKFNAFPLNVVVVNCPVGSNVNFNSVYQVQFGSSYSLGHHHE